MIHPNANDTLTVRSVFVIGPDNKVKLTLTYPAVHRPELRRALRVIDSLQLTAKHKLATPADWKQGEDVIIAGAVSDEEAKEIYPDGWETKKPYLRVVKQPTQLIPRARLYARRQPVSTQTELGEAARPPPPCAPRRRRPPGPTPRSRRRGG